MQAGHSKQVWSGFLRHVILIIATVLVFSIITIGIAAAYGKQLSQAPISDTFLENPVPFPYAHRWSNASFVFYSGTMPLLTIIHSTIDLTLYFTIGLNPISALTSALIFLTGWAAMLGLWGRCDADGSSYENSLGLCYQDILERTPDGGAVVGVSTELGDAKVAFAVLLLLLYVAYASFAAVAVHKRRVQKRSMRIGMKVLDSPEQGLGHK